jgi:hypothetical protein
VTKEQQQKHTTTGAGAIKGQAARAKHIVAKHIEPAGNQNMKLNQTQSMRGRQAKLTKETTSSNDELHGVERNPSHMKPTRRGTTNLGRV